MFDSTSRKPSFSPERRGVMSGLYKSVVWRASKSLHDGPPPKRWCESGVRNFLLIPSIAAYCTFVPVFGPLISRILATQIDHDIPVACDRCTHATHHASLCPGLRSTPGGQGQGSCGGDCHEVKAITLFPNTGIAHAPDIRHRSICHTLTVSLLI